MRTRHTLLLILIITLLPGLAFAGGPPAKKIGPNTDLSVRSATMSTSRLVPVSVAELPATGVKGTTYQVDDAADAADCTVGGGTVTTECFWTGSAYVSRFTGGVGPTGSSAYELAVANGFSGTVAQWLASLESTVPGPATVWWSGFNTPAAAGVTGTDGDYFFDTSQEAKIFKRIAGVWTQQNAIRGPAGVSTYVYIAYASSNTGTGFSLTPSDSLKYRAEIRSASEIASPDADDFVAATWVKMSGDDGAPGANGLGFSSCTPGSGDCRIVQTFNTVTYAGTIAAGECHEWFVDESGTKKHYRQCFGEASATELGSGLGGYSPSTSVADPGSDTNLPTEQAVRELFDTVSVGAPVAASAPTYSDSTCTKGQYAFSATRVYFCKATDTWDYQVVSGSDVVFANWSNPMPVTPTLTARVIGTDGTTLTLTGSASLSVGASGNGGFDVDCVTAGNGITATYASGAPGSNLVYTLGTAINSGDTCDLDYTQPGNGIEATTGGADLASITSGAITNNSTQSGSACSGGIATAQGSTTTSTGTANEEASVFYTRFTASATGNVNLATIRTQYGGPTEYVWVAVYDSTGALIGQSSGFGTSDAAGDASGALTSSVCIESAGTYYLAFQLSAGSVIYFFAGADSGNNIWKLANTYANGPPSSINPGTNAVESANTTFNCRVSYQ
ncbi:MAG TPA: hypothetical protein DCZ95_12545 [Verrucomicrobia bacterium]|nr:hypothetical protein [Verrucomicrobiota bacterium]